MTNVEDPKYKLSAKDRIIVVMGPTGAGKSTFIEHATQQNGGSVRHSLQSQSVDIRAVRTKHPDDQGSVVFVDTPGFDDTNRSDNDILAQIARWFVKVYKEKVPISAILYLHRISDNKMAGSPLRNFQMFAFMCGQGAMPRVILGTTMWSETKPDTGERREQELKTTFWADMIAQGCKVQHFGDSYESAWGVIGKLPTEQENDILSREIYDNEKIFSETAAGIMMTECFNRLIADHKAAARRLDDQINSQDNPLLVAELQRKRDEIEEKINHMTGQLQLLKIPFAGRIWNFFTGKKPQKSGIYVPLDAGR
ncbi:hypothetical protein FIBSPDRAFT_969882 [Athelia psychrophila]|uniref:G domain-containing protein n=1 Tax=Athelia psychrophila TaxID=1759441 RepID=A0A167T3P4_9AGAM|nr:hypothetical protein FIBSPDRAFT_969882 [Fibularhizoctonia sp. CBS 109695]